MAVNKIRKDDWIQALRPDTKDISNQYMVLEGYIGKSSVSDQHVRVYSDETLNDFIEISESDIAYCADLKDSPLGGSKLWVNVDAIFHYGDPKEKKRSKGSFLSGDLAGGLGAVAAIPPTVIRPQCCAGGTLVFSPRCFTIIQPTCFRTCNVTCNFTCRFSCNITCRITCNIVICRPTIIQPHCYQVTPHLTNLTTPQIAHFQQSQNQFGGATGYEGFDPYQGL